MHEHDNRSTGMVWLFVALVVGATVPTLFRVLTGSV